MDKSKIVLIEPSQIINDLLPSFMEYMRKEEGFYVIFIVSTIEDIKFYNKKFKNHYDEIIHSSMEFDFLSKKFNINDLNKKALEIEKRLGVTLSRLFLSDRTIGRGLHASGGVNHPKIRLHSNSSHAEIIKIAVSKVIFWEKLIKKKGVCMTLGLPNVGHLIAQNYKLPSYRVYDARFGNRMFWTSDLYLQPDSLESYYNKNKNKVFKKINIELPYQSYMTFRKLEVHTFKFIATLKFSFIQILRRFYGIYRGYRKAKNIYAYDEFKYIWRKRKDFNNLRKTSNINNKSLKNIKYIYFPLIAEPEVALHGIAQDFFFQLSAINMLSRDLPSNYRIIVKEHLLAIGRRPRDFYRQILDLKNVMMADPLDLGLPYIKNAQAVACITGTAAWEAVVMGIPVISFSKNNAFNFLEHVFTVTDPDDTIKILNNICFKSWPNKKSINDGASFYNSCIKDSFDALDRDSFISWGKEKTTKDKEKKTKVLAKILFKELKLKVKNNKKSIKI